MPLELSDHFAQHFSYFRLDSGTKRATGDATETKNCSFTNTDTANVISDNIAVGIYIVRVFASASAHSVQQEKKTAAAAVAMAVAASRARTRSTHDNNNSRFTHSPLSERPCLSPNE